MRFTSHTWRFVERLVAFASVIAVTSSVAMVDHAALADSGKGGGSSTAPTVTGVAPNTGPAAGGTRVTISGTNLVDPTGASRSVVKFGPNTADPASVSCTATSCTVTGPPGMDRVDVSVTVGNLTSARDSKDRFFYVPKLTSIDPTSGPAAGNTPVTIVGEGLAPGATTFAFGATPVTAVVSCAVDGKRCTTSTPSGASGTTVNVVATVSGQASNAIPFAFEAATTPNAILALSTSSLTFPDTPTGQTSAAQAVTLSSNGTAPVTIQNIAITGDFAQTNTCGNAAAPALPRDLAPGTSCTVSVTFAPTLAGSRTGSLTITDGAGKTYPVSLGGIGAAGQVSLTPSSLDFGTLNTAGPASAPQTATLRNGGTAPLTMSSIAITGTGDFSQTNTCGTLPATLAAGASCAINVAFKPTTVGAQTASLSVTDNAAGSPHSVALQGSGTIDSTPVIDSITPSSGRATGGETVVIGGRNFSATAGATQISIGGTPASGVSCTTTACSLVTPAGQIGAQPISLKVNGQVATNPTNVQFTYNPVTNSGSLTTGPIDPATGLPAWYRDSAGRHLDLCIDQVLAKCLASAPDPNQPVSFPGNFPDEAFYWNATATMPAGGGGATAKLVLATESLITAGVPSVFTRVRVNASGLTPGADYTLTYPYGVKKLTAGADGAIKDTIDVTGPLTGGAALNSDIGPFLTWPSGAPAGYIGDPTVNRPLTGSPIGQNVFRLDGPNAGGNGVNTAQTDQFALQGRLAAPKASPKGGVYTAAQSVTLTPTDPTATVLYTTDGSTPTGASQVANTNTPIQISATTTLKFVEQYTDGGVSPVVTEQYTLDVARSAPTITALAPTSGPAYGGTKVDVSGTNFSTVPGATTIKFGSAAVAAQNVSCDSETHCTAVSPGGPVGTVDVTATVAGQTSAVSATDPSTTKFTYTEVDNHGSVNPGSQMADNGYPTEYTDSRGLRLELCLDQTSGFCLAVPPDPSKPVSFPFNFPDEAFYWNATVDLPGVGPGGTGRALLVLGTEAAFATPDVRPGQQIDFNRIRIRISNLVAGHHYTVTHPYGVEDLVAEQQPDGTGRINTTVDIGCLTPPCAFTTPLGPNPDGPSVGPWLRWDSGAPEGFIGDGVSEHTVTGSPIGQNVFRIDGPNAGGVGVNHIESNQFVLQGKLAGPKVSADKPGSHYSSPLDVKLTATDAAGEASQIWYTLDGSTPRTDGSSLSYDASKGIHIDLGNTTLKFLGKNASGGLSPVYTENYVVGAVPTASPAGGAYSTAQTVTLTPSDPTATIYYTLDGSDPQPNVGTTAVYSAPLTITSTTTLKFIEVRTDGTASPIVTEVYNLDAVKPVVITDSPVPGYYHTVQQVSFRANKPADIWYTSTTGGSTPPDPLGADGKLSGTKFDGKPISVGVDTTFALRGVDAVGNVSDLTMAVYRVNTLNVAVGPIDNATGYPTFYTDNNNLSLQLCVDTSGACLTSVPDPSQPPSVPGNFIDEAFYWNATATMNAGNGGKATLVLATEAAFATGPVIQGQQIAFNRIRVKVTNLTPGATYTITHPYGTDVAVADDGGTIFTTDDIGCLDPGTGCLASTILGGRLGPWLTWDSGAPDGYVGDGVTPHLVTGSPFNTNYFLIEGPSAGGPGIDRAETQQFVVAGKLSSTVTPPVQPTIPAAPTGLTATAGNAQVGLTWSASAGASSYTVKRSTTAGTGYQVVATGLTTTSFSDTSVTNATAYFYVVTAVNAAGESGASNEATATPQAPVTAPAVSFNPTSLAFGQTKGGQKVGTTSVPLVTTLTNSGTGTLNISNISLGGASPTVFAIAGNSCGSTLAPGASCSITITFTPRVKGTVTAALNVTDDLGTQTVALTGKGN